MQTALGKFTALPWHFSWIQGVLMLRGWKKGQEKDKIKKGKREKGSGIDKGGAGDSVPQYSRQDVSIRLNHRCEKTSQKKFF